MSGMSVDQARVALLAAVTLTELERSWKSIQKDFSETQRAIPAALESDYHSLREELASAAA